jgi:hypothetical protein
LQQAEAGFLALVVADYRLFCFFYLDNEFLPDLEFCLELDRGGVSVLAAAGMTC